jgi:hypothetical protein
MMGSTKYDSAVSNPLISGFVSGNPNTKYESSLGPVPLLALASPTVREPVSSEHDEPFNFGDLHCDLEGIEASMIVRAWSACLGIAALLDFSAAMVSRPALLSNSVLREERETKNSMEILPRNRTTDKVVEFLQENSFAFGIAFSLMWFVDSFVEAKRRKNEAFRTIDRAHLLGETHNENSKTNFWKLPLVVYYKAISVQLLLLPVGFFVFAYSAMTWLSDPCCEDQIIQIVHRTDKDDVPDEYDSFTKYANVSLGFAVLKHLLITLSRRTGYHFKRRGIDAAKYYCRLLIFKAFRHPFVFGRRVRMILKLVRWAKYLAPLIGAIGKLKTNLSDLYIRFKQYRKATHAKRVRMRVLGKLQPDALREHCALIIQKTFRSHRSRKSMRAFKLLRGHSEYIAAVKLQKQFRMILARGKTQILRKKDELKRLRAMERKSLQRMEQRERLKMYKLQEELKAETRYLLNEKLLLRPNTTFSVTWKFLFVLAVLFDISQLALKPMLLTYRNPRTGQLLQLERVLGMWLIPVPLREQEVCAVENSVLSGPLILRAIQRKIIYLKRKHRHAAQDSLPWYCSEYYERLQTIYIQVLEFGIHRFFAFVGFICFMDVFVTFFTGDFDELTGVLKPKPLFQRWIAPGMALQLLVNPKVEGASHLVARLLMSIVQRGPVRVLRWAVALFFPVLLFVTRLLSMVWQNCIVCQKREVLF